jgi:hypothetical protein
MDDAVWWAASSGPPDFFEGRGAWWRLFALFGAAGSRSGTEYCRSVLG